MYDRATRSFQQKVGCTPDHVGPGTYDHRRHRNFTENYAPFLSLSTRGEVFGFDENPGPGHYDLRRVPLSVVKGGSTLANRASRFDTKQVDETPGPGSYDVFGNQIVRSSTIDSTKPPRHNTLAVNRKSVPPSIPDPKYAYGFEEDGLGRLIPQNAPDKDESLGPAYYNAVAPIETDGTKFYQGVHFGKYSSKRTEFGGKAGPGPGEYDPFDTIRLEVQNMNMKSLERRQELHIPRYPEVMLKAVAKESIPGPGQYIIKRDLDPEPSKTDITGLDFDRPPFGSQSKRFGTSASFVPGPASYDDKVLTAFNTSQTKPTTFKRVPFNQTATRFLLHDYKASSAPGPGQYRISGFTDESLRRAVVDGGRKPPFNVASMRQTALARKDDFNTPGPSSYDVRSQPFKPRYEPPSANFISHSTRDLTIEDIPGPTSYDVTRAFQALTTHRRRSPRSKAARKRQGQFLSAAKRIFGGESTNDTPGPGAYDGFVTTRTHGFAPIRESRFRDNVSKLPGPAAYELSPLLQDTVLRGTFNSTLNNPILAKLQSRVMNEEKQAATDTVSVMKLPVLSETSADLTTHA